MSKNKALIITGQNNHNWEKSSVLLQEILDISGIFTTEILISPLQGEDMTPFQPNFSKYDVIVLDYNGDAWPEQVNKDFLEYVNGGGGVVVYHAADNSFPEWKEYNEIIGLGGWGNRNEDSGPYVYWEEGEIIENTMAGRGGDHGQQHAFQVVNRDTIHPITKGLPERWMHAQDELYGLLRGPGKNMTVLSTAYSDTATGGSGRHEPVLFTISFGEGRIFHTVLGHAGSEEKTPAMKCAGFITTLQRGAEWAATGTVTLAIPENLPNAASVVEWPELRPLNLDELMTKAARYKIGQSRKYLADLSERIRNAEGSEKALQNFETKMLDLLNSDATTDCKNYIMKELSWMGSENSIPTLEELSNNEDTADMANFALKRLQ
jgi:type 1 glutamine amidotransferase